MKNPPGKSSEVLYGSIPHLSLPWCGPFQSGLISGIHTYPTRSIGFVPIFPLPDQGQQMSYYVKSYKLVL